MTEQRLRQVVKEAVKEELLGANLVDGPTHLAHHQEIENLIHERLLVFLALLFLAYVLG